MYHIAICDDEKNFVAEMKVLLQNYTKETGTEFRISVFEDGKYLIENYHLIDHRQDNAYNQWNLDYQSFMKKNKLL